ncbi:hypothetical protein Glove_217g181 [Diversispora epigaea]|uniref:Uncharacterized protein n=1 Tax=Diversispora epigaea TaxID=1348612 RepID=A0A397IJI3_9GLOM|nr:hypothetical protein Glove_217g181 [Diversispora epigaea]
MRKVVSFKRVSRTRLKSREMPYHSPQSFPSPNNTSKILWNLDFGQDDSDDNDGDDEDDDDNDNDNNDDDDDEDECEFIWFMLGWQKDIMVEKCEELQVIENPEKVEYPPNEFIQKYHPSGSIHFIRISNNKFDRTQRYARRRGEMFEKINEALKHCIDDVILILSNIETMKHTKEEKLYISLQKDVSGEEASGRVDYEIKGKKDLKQLTKQ